MRVRLTRKIRAFKENKDRIGRIYNSKEALQRNTIIELQENFESVFYNSRERFVIRCVVEVNEKEFYLLKDEIVERYVVLLPKK